MTDVIDPTEGVRAHYRATGLTERLKAALAVFGADDARLTPQQLGSLDQFHTLGIQATSEIAELAGLGPSDAVLDVGCGIGGPARFLAASHGCRAHGIDLSEPFVDAARYLTERTGQGTRVTFEVGSALDLPVHDSEFDVVLLQHVAMNIVDRARLYRELRRVLRRGGRFATFDVVRTGGSADEPYYPVPWARTPQTSFLLDAAETTSVVCGAGFTVRAARDDTEAAKAWIRRMREAGPPPAPNLGVVIGADFMELATNLGRNLLEGRVGIFTAVFEAN
jgi:SAM-dependent methyltransferase